MSDTRQNRGYDHEKAVELFRAAVPGTDRRSLRTRQALHQALMQLIVEQGYEAISVADIADAANVGRSTFYAHFTDKDDLLRSGLGNLRAMVLQEHAAAGAASDIPTAKVIGFSAFMTEHLYEQRRLFHSLMKGQAGPIILEVISSALRDIVRDELKRLGVLSHGQPSREMTTHFVVGSYVSIVTTWLERGAKEKPESVCAGFRALALGGLSGLASAS